MSYDNQDNDQHLRYNERLAKLEQRSVIALSDHQKKQRRVRLKKQLPKLKKLQFRSNLQRVLSIVLPFTLVLVACLYLISPWSKLTEVTVSGNHYLNSAQVKAATNVKPGRLIWATLWTSDDRLAQIQKQNAQIKQVRVHLTGWRSVKVTLKEYQVIGLITINGKERLLLSNGKTRPTGNTTVNQFISYAGFKKHPKMLRTTAKQIGELDSAIKNGISEVTYSPTTLDDERLQLLMNDGNTVYVKASQLKNRMSYYPSIVANTSGNRIINLEFGAYSYKYSAKDE